MYNLTPRAKIRRIVDRIRPLAHWIERSSSQVNVLTVSSAGFETIRRNPDIAQRFGISLRVTGLPRWRSFTIRAAPKRSALRGKMRPEVRKLVEPLARAV